MAFQLIVNIVIAIIWMFLTESYTFSDLFIGFIVGMVLLFVMRRFIPDSYYLTRVNATVKLVFLFFKELVIANFDIVKIVYRRKLEDVRPGIFTLHTDLRTNWEITILANLITLTPGTLSVYVSDDNSRLYIHAMDIADVEESINAIKHTFEKAIKEVTR